MPVHPTDRLISTLRCTDGEPLLKVACAFCRSSRDRQTCELSRVATKADLDTLSKSNHSSFARASQRRRPGAVTTSCDNSSASAAASR
jgi:hypothetical protein